MSEGRFDWKLMPKMTVNLSTPALTSPIGDALTTFLSFVHAYFNYSLNRQLCKINCKPAFREFQRPKRTWRRGVVEREEEAVEGGWRRWREAGGGEWIWLGMGIDEQRGEGGWLAAGGRVRLSKGAAAPPWGRTLTDGRGRERKRKRTIFVVKVNSHRNLFITWKIHF